MLRVLREGPAGFEGGLSAAVEDASGKKPRIYHNDHSRPERPVIRTLEDEIGRVVRSRVVNPKWIAGVRRHGYKGAFEIAATVDYMFAFAATTGAVRDHHFEAAYQAQRQRVDVLFAQWQSLDQQLKAQQAITAENLRLMNERKTERDNLLAELEKARADAKTALANLQKTQRDLFTIQKQLRDAHEALFVLHAQLRDLEAKAAQDQTAGK